MCQRHIEILYRYIILKCASIAIKIDILYILIISSIYFILFIFAIISLLRIITDVRSSWAS